MRSRLLQYEVERILMVFTDEKDRSEVIYVHGKVTINTCSQKTRRLSRWRKYVCGKVPYAPFFVSSELDL